MSDRNVDVFATIHGFGVVPVVEIGSLDQAEPLLAALVRGGLPLAEITLRTETGLQTIRHLRAAYPDVLVGAGTVRSVRDAENAIEAGAQFVVSPGTIPTVIETCRSLGVPAIPGVCTPTEIDSAADAGAKVVKFFPAEAIGGIPFLEALAAPFPDIRFAPSGGINSENLSSYIRLPCVLACGGSWMVAPALLADSRYDRIETLAREAFETVHATRTETGRIGALKTGVGARLG